MSQLDLVVTQNQNALAMNEAERKTDQRKRYAENVKETIAPNTLTAYRSQWKQFARWLNLVGMAEYSDETYNSDKDASLAESIAAMALRASDVLITIDRYLKSTQEISLVRTKRAAKATVIQAYAAIKALCDILYHDVTLNGGVNPCETKDAEKSLRAVLSEITKQIKGTSKKTDEKREAPKPKDALKIDLVEIVVRSITGDSIADLRDKVILLLGFAGGFRRSELCELRVSDLRFIDVKQPCDENCAACAQSCEVTVRFSKNDQEAKGMTKALLRSRNKMLCPITALHALISAAQLSGDDYLLQSTPKGGRRYTGIQLQAQDIARILKRRCEKAGLDSTNVSGHSLRRGFVSTAYEKGADFYEIMKQTGHRSLQVVMRYVDNKNCFEHNAVSKIFND